MQPDTNTIKEIAENFLNKTPFIAKNITVSLNKENNTFWCTIETNDSRFLIGHSGETLRAINHLIRRIITKNTHDNLEEKPPYNIIVDINGYQKKRFDSLRATAHMLAERARFFKSKIDVDPMSPFERRIIHEYLSNEQDLKTQSVGDGLNRHIVISYIDN